MERKKEVAFLREGLYPNAHYESGAIFEEKVIFCFKSDKKFVNFDLSAEKSKKIAL